MLKRFKLEKLKYDVLCHKKRFKRYSDIQKSVIVNDYIKCRKIKETSHKYKAPASTIYKFLRDSKSKSKKNIL